MTTEKQRRQKSQSLHSDYIIIIKSNGSLKNNTCITKWVTVKDNEKGHRGAASRRNIK